MPIHNSDGTLTEDRSIVVYDPSKNRHVPAGHIWDASLNKFVPSGEPVKLPASMIPLSTETGNALRLSQADGNLYVAPTAVINVADDQGLTASETDSARVTVSSTTVDTLVNGVHETTVNHDFHVDVKVAATPASGIANALSTHADGLYVAKEILGEDVPPSTASDGGVSATIYGGLNATMGDPSGWLQLAIPQADGAIWLFKVPHYGKTVVPTGQNVFTYKPTTEGEGETPPPPETPPGGEGEDEVPPMEETPPTEGGEGGGNNPPPAEDAYTTAINKFSTIVVNNGAEAPWTYNYRAFQAVMSAVSAGNILKPANWFELSNAIIARMTPTPSTFNDHVGHVQFMQALGFDAFDLTTWNSMVSGAISTSNGNLAGALKIKTQFDAQDQFLKVVPGAENSLVSIFLNNQFVWTTNPAEATLFSSTAVNAILANVSFTTIRGADVGEFAKIGTGVQVI